MNDNGFSQSIYTYITKLNTILYFITANKFMFKYKHHKEVIKMTMK
jgi:hypothetical protein